MAVLTDQDKLNKCEAGLREGFRPPPNYSIAEWADKKRILPKSGSDQGGQWKTSRTPYLREVMEVMSPRDHCEEIVFMKGSQVGATECLINAIMFHIEHDPCPMLLIEPTITVAKRVAKKRIGPSIAACPSVRVKIPEAKSRDSGNTTLEKEFPGGTLTMGGANSAASLRSMPIRIFLADELDGYPEDIDGEGAPEDLGDRRTTNFSRKKKIYVSTPTLTLTSKIHKKFQESDQRYYYVPCPFCKEKQIIKRENLIYDNNDPKTVRLRCAHCGKDIHEHHKTWMLENGEWRKLNPKSDIPGFHISAFYSPLGWYSWRQAIKDYLRSIGNPKKAIVFKNTVEGEPYDEAEISIDAKEISKRTEPYAAEVPNPVLCLVGGFDVHDNRIEGSIIGIAWHDRVIEPYLIDHRVFFGDPTRQALWDDADAFLLRSWRHESGAIMNVAAAGFDAMGHCTDEVYAYCSRVAFRKIFALQGKGGAGRPLVSAPKLNKRHRVFLFRVGVDQAKDTIYSKLSLKQDQVGRIHFPTELPPGDDGAKRSLDVGYFEQLTAEKKKIKYTGGLPIYYYECPEGKRNEALDCFVYGLAALNILNPNLALLAKEKRVFTSNYSRPVARGRRVISKGVE
jgi:phage terminase large subunit GpA-like protein